MRGSLRPAGADGRHQAAPLLPHLHFEDEDEGVDVAGVWAGTRRGLLRVFRVDNWTHCSNFTSSACQLTWE